MLDIATASEVAIASLKLNTRHFKSSNFITTGTLKVTWSVRVGDGELLLDAGDAIVYNVLIVLGSGGACHRLSYLILLKLVQYLHQWPRPVSGLRGRPLVAGDGLNRSLVTGDSFGRPLVAGGGLCGSLVAENDLGRSLVAADSLGRPLVAGVSLGRGCW